MCGIVGYIGSGDALQVILSGLEKLEYRGYDSAGVALLRNNEVAVVRALGKLAALRKAVVERGVVGPFSVGIGHTRWATHGRPSENNAHPHSAGRVSLIHNGIIENYIELREELEREGREFRSETDTEIAAHLLNRALEKGLTPFEAIKDVCRQVRGSYAFVALDSQHPDRLLIAKNATPIVVGVGASEVVVASDIPAVLPVTRNVLILEDGDIAEVRVAGISIENQGKPVERAQQHIAWDPVTAQKGGFKHFMLKEIHEQAQVIAETFRGRVQLESTEVTMPELTFTDDEIRSFRRAVFIACGTAWHACLVGKFYFEQLIGIPCEVDYASEFRYRSNTLDKDTLVIAVSQSGETADTLAAIEKAGQSARTLAVCNVLGSSIARKVKDVVFTHAGPEISVASTKAFTTQLVALFLLALHIGKRRGKLTEQQVMEQVKYLIHIPQMIYDTLKVEGAVEQVAKRHCRARDYLFLGRGICYPIALEGALKLKEISYIHAEGYPAGEMKHGPIALIDENMPVVVLLQRTDPLFEKILSNLREVESRGGRIIALTDTVGNRAVHEASETVIEVPYISDLLCPILFTLPLQLLAYYTAVLNGTDVDLPRNLAKSVTVE